MMDYIAPILTGLFTGIGVSLANWLHTRHIEKKLDKIDEVLKNVSMHKPRKLNFRRL